MNNLAKAGIGCGCLPAVLLAFACAACFVLVAVGAINYSEEDTVMIVGALLLAAAAFFGVIGAVLVTIGIVQSRNRGATQGV